MRRGLSHLTLMLLVTAGVVLIGALQKAPCANEAYVVRRAATPLPCYSDLSALYRFEQLAGGRVPYLDPCRPALRPCDEYPVLTMFAMWGATAVAAGSPAAYAGFFWANIALLLCCALLATWALERIGARTVLFAAAPALALYGSLNWDLMPVAAVALATWLFLRRRDGLAGVLLGLGAAAKIYPALLLVPFCAERLRESRRDAAGRMLGGAAGTWLVLNVPFALAAPKGWSEFLQFTGSRGADYESGWAILCRFGVCFSPGALSLLTVVITAGATWWIWRRVVRRQPDLPRWMMALPLLVMLLFSGKAWSPQYGLWVLPWLSITRIPVRTFAAYQLSEVLEFMTRTLFLVSPPGSGVVTFGILAVVVILRATLLLRCLTAWMRDPSPVSPVGVPAPATGS